MMAHERCVRKKMRSLFEYLDTDGDGRISQQCLLQGLNRLQSLELNNEEEEKPIKSSTEAICGINPETNRMEICEYEVNELMRCVPEADSLGGITLQKFLEAESALTPGLTRLRLLQ
jgi:Ca2+-binding EF-hand superfamily protein